MQFRRHRLVFALCSAVLTSALALACGGSDGDSGSNATRSSSAASPAASPTGSGAGSPFTRTSMLALAGATEVEGYDSQEPVPGAGGANVTVGYEAVEGGSGLSAFVTLSPCDPFLCWDLDAEVTFEHESNLKSSLSRVHIDNPDLVFEYGTIEIETGYEAFFVYSRSFVADGSSTSTSNTYRLFYHDGRNLISLQIAPAFGPLPDSAEELEMQMDRAKGEMAARDIFAAYAGAFQPVD